MFLLTDKQKITVQINSTMAFCQIGKWINEEIQKNKPVEHGKNIVPTVSSQLKKSMGIALELEI